MKTIIRSTVAVCDILGFKRLVMTRPLDQLLERQLSFFRRLLSYSIKHENVPDLPPNLIDLRAQNRVGFAMFSDTILIYSKDDDDISCRNVIETVAWIILTNMSTELKIRAGIAYGEFFADPENELYYGPALVEAYELEKAQEWAGGSLTIGAAKRIPPITSTGERFQWYICNYPVPLKPDSGIMPSGIAVDWTQYIHNSMPFVWSEKNREPTEEDKSNHPSEYNKFKNTKKFHEDVCVQCFPENRGKYPLKVI